MKYCPMCEATYGDEVEVCAADGATLKVAGAKQDPLIGQTIKGRYRVAKKLGTGGMGTVYLAEQVNIGRKVGLKVLHREYAEEEEFVRRFRHEARLAASLNHRNVIVVHDFDQADDGSLFLAMEYVDGRSLRDVIKEGPLDVGRALRLGIQIAEGLRAAHRAGVIHRDVKPENIMLLGEGEEIKLMDFGISRLKDRAAMTQLTRSGVIMGTPAYMSPEMIERGEVSERSDIYAFGIMLYEMLSGAVPFRAPTPSGVLMKHLRETAVSVRKLQPEIPPSIEQVVMQAIEKKPQSRQQNMEEVAQGLKKAEEILEQVEVTKTLVEAQSPRLSVTERFQGTKRTMVVSIIVLILVVAGAWSIVWFRGGKGEDRTKTTQQARLVSLAAYAEKRELNTKEQTSLTVKGRYSDGGDRDVIEAVGWQSSDPSVVSVDTQGLVEGRKVGHADITARSAGVVSPPLTLFVKGEPPPVAGAVPPQTEDRPALESKPVVADGKIREHLKQARLFRERGNYLGAIKELRKAKAIDPTNEEVQAEVQIIRKACRAARKRGLTDLPC